MRPGRPRGRGCPRRSRASRRGSPSSTSGATSHRRRTMTEVVGRRRQPERRGRGRGGPRDPARPRVTRAPSPDEPLTWSTSPPCSASRPARSATTRSRVSRSISGPTCCSPGRSMARFHLARTNRGLLVGGDARTALAEICSRCLRADRGPDRHPDRRGGPAEHRPDDRRARSTTERRAGRRPPDRPPRARARAARPRGDPAGRADRAAVPPGLPGPVPVCGERLDERRPRPRRRRRSTPGSRRSGRSGSTARPRPGRHRSSAPASRPRPRRDRQPAPRCRR